MGVQLDKIVVERAEHYLEKYKADESYSEDTGREAVEALSDRWRSEIKKEVLNERTEEEIAEMKAQIDKERERYSTKKAVEDLRGLIVEGIILAIIVGLFVNQATDIISYLKGTRNWIVTLVIMGLMVLALFTYVLGRLASIINRLLKK